VSARAIGPAVLRALPLLAAVAAALAFLPSLAGEWLSWDDYTNFVENPGYRGLGTAQLKWMFTATLMGHYIPLTWLTLGFNYAVGGMSPWGYHALNIAIHALSTAVFYLVARRLLLAARPATPAVPVALGALAAALVFGLHPLRAESVAWVTERRDVLSGLFYLLTVLAYLRGAQGGGPVTGRWRWLSLAAYVAAMLSKSMVMTLPASLLLLDVYPLRRWRALGPRAVLREKLPWLAVAVLGAGISLLAVRRGAQITGYSLYGPESRIALVFYSFWFYPWKWLAPLRLSPLYELPDQVRLLDARFLLPALTVIAVTALLLALARRWPAGLAAWAHSAIVLVPISGVVHAGFQLAHDRYSYLSGFGFCLLAGAAVAAVAQLADARRISRPVAAVAATAGLLAVAGLGAATWQQTQIWRSGETLWSAGIDADPECTICWNNLGYTLMVKGDHRGAEPFLRKAIALRPHRARTWNNLGSVLAATGRMEEAAVAFEHAVARGPSLADAVGNLGAAYARLGRYDEAVAQLRRALELDPTLRDARINLAYALMNQGVISARAGRVDTAMPLFQEAARLVPDDPIALRNLGEALLEQGNSGEALVALERAVQLDAGSAHTHSLLARAYAMSGSAERAERALVELARLDPALAERTRTRVRELR
jgi:Flp pilus assembly protein TadD